MKSDISYLQHMFEAADWIMSLSVQGKEIYLTDVKTQDSIIRKFELIGEAASKLSPNFRLEHPEIPWGNLIGMRNRLIHDYMGVDLELVWTVAIEIIPPFKDQIFTLISSS